jgi:hypothetical protein
MRDTESDKASEQFRLVDTRLRFFACTFADEAFGFWIDEVLVN